MSTTQGTVAPKSAATLAAQLRTGGYAVHTLTGGDKLVVVGQVPEIDGDPEAHWVAAEWRAGRFDTAQVCYDRDLVTRHATITALVQDLAIA